MADKQQALVNSLANGVTDAIKPEFKALTDMLAKLSVTLNSSLARIEAIESAVTVGATGGKRAVRTGTAAKGTAAKKGGAKKGTTGDDKSKVTNALLYFRYAIGHELNEFREVYGTEENLQEAEKDSAVAKRDVGKDEVGYWSAVGNALWKSVLTDEQKDEVRLLFNAWKEERAREEAEAPLEEDVN